MRAESGRNLAELRFEYAWRWFALHARQRVSMFNYFLIASGILANGYVLLVRENLNALASGLAVIGFVTGCVFILLDQRNRSLVHLGEDLLKDLERTMFPNENVSGQPEISVRGPLVREDEGAAPHFFQKHGFLFKVVEGVFAVGFLIAFILAVID